MAGETRGILAEAIAKVATEIAIQSQNRPEKVFWGESPKGAIVSPDITIGINADQPSVLVLVNASDNVRNSNMKFWRNVSEIFDAKSRLSPRPQIINLVFKSEIKPELIKLVSGFSDAIHLVDQDPIHGPAIVRWLETNHTIAPSDKSGKEKLVLNAISPESRQYDGEFAGALAHLSLTIAGKLNFIDSSLDPLWAIVTDDYQSRMNISVRQARMTMLRRGVSRWLVFDDAVRRSILLAHLSGVTIPRQTVPPYAMPLKMLQRTISGANIDPSTPDKSDMMSKTSYDLRQGVQFFLRAASKNIEAAVNAIEDTLLTAPAEMRTTAALLRLMPSQVSSWHDYVVDNWDILKTPIGCYRALMACWEGVSANGEEGETTESRVWLYDHLLAILRAVAKENNNFGYGTLVSYFKKRRDDPALNQLFSEVMADLDPKRLPSAQKWVESTFPNSAEPGRRGFQDWLAKKKDVTPVIVAAFSYSLAGLLARVSDLQSVAFDDLVGRHAYSLWNKLLTYPDFEPLLDLIEVACGNRVSRVQASTLLVDLAGGDTGGAGFMPVLKYDGGLIMWQSVTDSGRDHKRKELAGRARALRYSKVGDTFHMHPAANNLILVIDGTFTDVDLKILIESGLDHIYYPDEMELLVGAIEAASSFSRLS